MRTRWLGTSTLVVLALAALFVGFAQTAFAQAQCILTVEPTVAVAGSEFHLHGSGFTPTELVLEGESGAPAVIELDLGEEDPFDIPIGSQKGDEGVWVATATEPGVCSASVSFTATLEETDALDDLAAASVGGSRLSMVTVALVMVFGIGGGAVLGRRLQRA